MPRCWNTFQAQKVFRWRRVMRIRQAAEESRDRLRTERELMARLRRSG